jgi:hypothetical protein
MQHILIPTDFSIRSLNAIHTVAANYAGSSVQVSMFHLLQPENDITQLFRSRRTMHLDMISREYHEACQILQNRYSSVISNLKIEFGFGTTVNYLSNLMEGLKISSVLACVDMEYNYTDKRSIDPLPLLRKTGIKIDAAIASHVRARNEKSGLNALPIKELLIPKTEDYVVTE